MVGLGVGTEDVELTALVFFLASSRAAFARSPHFSFGRCQSALKLEVSQVRQLAGKFSIKFLRGPRDRKWGGDGIVRCVGRFLRNNGGSNRFALNKRDAEEQTAFSKQRH